MFPPPSHLIPATATRDPSLFRPQMGIPLHRKAIMTQSPFQPQKGIPLQPQMGDADAADADYE